MIFTIAENNADMLRNGSSVIICDTCKEKCIGQTGEAKTKLRDRVRLYRQHIQQPQYQQLKVKEHLKVCDNGKFGIFLLLQMLSQNTKLK